MMLSPLARQTLDVLRGAEQPLSTGEIRQRLGLDSSKQAVRRLHHELNRLYTARLIDVERRGDERNNGNLWRAAGTAGGAS